MPEIFDERFKNDKKVSILSGKMFNRLQREYISQFSLAEQAKYYEGLDKGKVGEFPEKIPPNLR